jgi:hypothetical protein
MHAFYFQCADEGVDFVFAETSLDAKVIADVDEVTAAPEFDKYSPGPVLDSHRFSEGWPVLCRYCDHELLDGFCQTCTDENEDDMPTVIDGSCVYCDEECHLNHIAQIARIDGAKQEARAELLKTAPFVIPMHSHVGAPGDCTRLCFRNNPENIVVWFKVPGGTLSEKTQDGNAFHNAYCHGCGGIWIARGDKEAWDAAMAKK